MSTKLALILTGVWTLIVLVACGGGIWFLGTQVPRHQQEARGQMLANGMATVALIGYAAIMLPWAAAYGRKRREAKEAAARAREKDAPTPRKRKRRERSDDEED